jgi:hypothetical protein
MRPLEYEQAQVARIILAGPAAGNRRLPPLEARSGADPHARLNVYRNNTYASLTATLLSVFPVTTRLVDERYLRYAAQRFIASFPPSEPRLSRFGAAFPAFLATFERAASMRYVAETARLEWAIATALDTEIHPPLPISTLTCLEIPEQAVLDLQPSLRLMASRWPVFSIWTAHQQHDEPELDFVRYGKAERTALWRSGGSIRLVRLEPTRIAFLKSLVAGASIDEAASRALAQDRLFDLAIALAHLFAEGLVTGVARSPANQ